MPVTPTYPGVYIEELESGVHPITGVATSITAFVGFAPRGPVDTPTQVQSFLEYARVFGGLDLASTMSYAVQQFFQNGGQNALVVRANGAGAAASTGTRPGPPATAAMTLAAANTGEWGDELRMRIDYDTSDATLFNLSVKDTSTGVVEMLRNLPTGAALGPTIASRSNLVRLSGAAPTTKPDDHAAVPAGDDPFDDAAPTRWTQFGGGADGAQVVTDLVPAADDGTGMFALTRADLFNLLVIAPVLPSSNPGAGRVLTPAVKGRAADFASAHRAMFLVDPHPDWDEPGDITPAAGLQAYITNIGSDERRNSALYFPYLRAPDPLQGEAVMEYPPAGAIAGVMARTDTERGVWKAPAGLEAGLSGVQELKAKLTDGENGILNPLAVNCLRTFPASGHVVWGARTLAGNDALASEWKYVPVRRTALFLEESLFRGTQWVVFEPNDEPLWAQIRLNVGAFMQDLFRKGAFQGKTPREAYLVKCDAETTTQTDINNGVVNILVGFAPLKPAEFVIVQIQQLAGQIET